MKPSKLIQNVSRSVLRPFREAAGKFVLLPKVWDAFSKESILYKAAEIQSNELLEGDYLEFGVFRGASFISAFHTIKRVYEQKAADPLAIHSDEYCARVREAWTGLRFFAFDSFQGLPCVSGMDVHTNHFTKGKYSCNQKEFTENLLAHSVELDKVVMVPGWFEDTCSSATAQNHRLRAASIVHIDCDLYESTKIVLKFISPLLMDGTVIIFDDWYCFRGHPALGEQKAFTEWTETMPQWIFTQYQKEGPWRNSFIANRRNLVASN